MKGLLIAWMAGWLFFASQGCTRRAWYEGFREQQRQACYQYEGQGDIQRCLDRVNSMTYDQYERTREEMGKQSADD